MNTEVDLATRMVMTMLLTNPYRGKETTIGGHTVRITQVFPVMQIEIITRDGELRQYERSQS